MSSESAVPEDDVLAAEYVLRLLTDDESASVERRLDNDTEFSQRVNFWNERFSAFGLSLEGVQTSADVKRLIDQTLFGEAAAAEAHGSGASKYLSWWQGATAVLAAATLGLLALLLVGQMTPTAPAEKIGGNPVAMAAMEPTDAGPEPLTGAILLRIEPQQRVVTVSSFELEDAQARVPQLWLIAEGDQPRSVGLIDPTRTTNLSLAQQARAQLVTTTTFAISLEPEGGSPTGLPTGPVIAAGALKVL